MRACRALERVARRARDSASRSGARRARCGSGCTQRHGEPPAPARPTRPLRPQSAAAGAREAPGERGGVARAAAASRAAGCTSRRASPSTRCIRVSSARARRGASGARARRACAAIARAIRHDERRGAGGRRRARVGDEVADREVGLVADAGHDRHARLEHGARDDLLVERPQVLDRAAAAATISTSTSARAFAGADRRRDLLRGALALHGGRIEDRRARAGQRRASVVRMSRQRRGARRRDDADRARIRRAARACAPSSNQPAASSRAFSRSNFSYSAPTPASRTVSTLSWNSPRAS